VYGLDTADIGQSDVLVTDLLDAFERRRAAVQLIVSRQQAVDVAAASRHRRRGLNDTCKQYLI